MLRNADTDEDAVFITIVNLFMRSCGDNNAVRLQNHSKNARADKTNLTSLFCSESFHSNEFSMKKKTQIKTNLLLHSEKLQSR